MASPYVFVALTLCLDGLHQVLMSRESNPRYRGSFYVPAGRGNPGEDILAISHRTTLEKTGISVEPIGIIGIEHSPPIAQYPGQIRAFVVAQAREGILKSEEDEHSLEALWIPHEQIRTLRLRSTDVLSWIDDVVVGQPSLPVASWHALGPSE